MDAQRLRQTLNAMANKVVAELEIYSEIDSTNSELLRRFNDGVQHGCLVLAESQTQGRGRRGRTWVSPANGGLYMSLGLPFSNSTKDLQAVSLVTAISVAEAIKQHCGLDLQLKWPNDVLASNKKLAGILLERHVSQSQSYIVFGVGVNIEIADEHRKRLDKPIADLSTLTESAIAPDILAGSIVNHLVEALDLLQQEGFSPFQNVWNSYDRYFDSDIVIDDGRERMIGKSMGVNESGRLMLQTLSGLVTLNTGEIFPSLRDVEESGDDT